MLTKTEPFEDDFNDGNYNGWSVLGGSWSAANGVLVKTNFGGGNMVLSSTDADRELRFDYRFTSTSSSTYGVSRLRMTSGGDTLSSVIHPTYMTIGNFVSGVSTTLGSKAISTTAGQWYTIRAECDGSNVKVWRSTEGELETLIFNVTTSLLSSDNVTVGMVNALSTTSPFEFDNIRILADDLANNTTFAYNSANELTSMTGPNGTTTFTYDAWGRQTAKTLNGVTDTYGYRYGSRLYSVDLGTDSTVDVTYEYAGDAKPRSRATATTYRAFKWDGFQKINEEDNVGTLVRWINPLLGEAPGSPATAAVSYFGKDHLGSIRTKFGAAKSLETQVDYSPHGAILADLGEPTSEKFASVPFDDAIDASLFFFRTYSADSGWYQREPLGQNFGPNLYTYALADPVNMLDPIGLAPRSSRGRDVARERFGRCRRLVERTVERLRTVNSNNPNCNIPDDLNIHIGWFVPGTSVSLRPGNIRINLSWCTDYWEDPSKFQRRYGHTFDWFIAHEIGHANDDFSRWRYFFEGLIHPKKTKKHDPSVWPGKKEKEADDYATGCKTNLPTL